MEAEARSIPEDAVNDGGRNWVEEWLDAAESLRGDPLPIPERAEHEARADSSRPKME
jgi:hypothetical protein